MGELASTFGVDWPHLSAQLISFSIVCALLYRLAYQPVLRMLATRREQIAQGLANTEEIKARLAAIDGQRHEILAAATAQAATIVADARAVAVRLHDRETRQAKTHAEAIVLEGRETARLEYERMLAALRREVGHLVVQTTAAVAGKVLTAADQRRLTDETVRYLA
jgi:F-type H+-transporting ATPase subunit b